MMEQNPDEVNRLWMKSLTEVVKTVFVTITGWLKAASGLFITLLWPLLVEIHTLELRFINTIYIFCPFYCQFLFLTMCEIALLGDLEATRNEQEGIIGSLYLCFAFRHFVEEIKDICQTDWSQINYSFSNYARWIFGIMAVRMCIVVIYNRDAFYNALIFSYYICTEPLFIDLLIKSLSCFQISSLNCMEYLYVPIVLNVYVISCGAGVSVYLARSSPLAYALFSSYFVFYLRCKDFYFNYIKKLMLETQTYSSFRNATESDIQKWDDICAVCLCSMSNAVITPCNHLFHPACLKQCFRGSVQCPLCTCDLI